MKATNAKAQLLIGISFLLLALSMLTTVMTWVLVLVFISVALQALPFFKVDIHHPSVRTINLFAILCALALAYTTWQAGLMIAMINLLVMACALKILQMHTTRDYFIVVCVQFFLIGCGLIFEQSIFYAGFLAFVAILQLSSVAFHISPSRPLQKQIWLSIKISAQAMPICVLLFLVLPQLSPLWKMPSSQSKQTGLTEEITPGDIANLSQSGDLAFRAQFSGNIPAPHQRYWRGLVFEDFDGKTWRVSEARKKMKRINYRLGLKTSPAYDYSKEFKYDVIIEPTNQQFLFALDAPLTTTRRTWLSPDFQIQSTIPLVTKFKYSVQSYPNTPLKGASDYFDVNMNLQVPETGNPKTKVWVRELRQQHRSNKAFILAVETFFFTEPFSYTLRPDLMPFDPVDTFLFDKQAGFCAHFSSAYAYIMRLAGIPARVVGGYQGGEMRKERYMSIYQYDAHAWVEIWQPDVGWIRRDPTGFVAPDRISYGLERALAYEESFLEDSPFSLMKWRNTAVLNEIRLVLADIDFFWSKWVLGFDQERQLNLFRLLVGEIKPIRIALLLLAILFVISLFLLLFNYRVWFPKITNYPLHFYLKSLKYLAKRDIIRAKQETPMAFYIRIAKQLSVQQQELFLTLTEQFNQVTYEVQTPSQEHIKAMRQALKAFKKSL